MKFFPLIFFLAALLAGCAQVIQGTAVLPPIPLLVKSPLSQAQPLLVLPPPSTAAPLWFHFIFPVDDLTNRYVESSTDLLNWVRRDDITLVTNITDAETNIFWNLPRDMSKPREFYKAGGTN
jgi:hypothetical protein